MPSLNEELAYGSDRHRRVVQGLLARLDFSDRELGDWRKRWTDAENQYRAYLPETEVDAKLRAKRSSGEPQATTLILPYSTALCLTAHTYLTSVFLGRSPVQQFMGRHGEAEMGVLAIEALMDYQVQVGEMLPTWYVWLLDTLVYGVGILGTYWDSEEIQVSRMVEQPVMWMGIPIPGKTEKTRITETIPGYSGNKTYNIRPFDYYPDPRVPIAYPDKGEFVAIRSDALWTDLLGGDYFNLETLRKVGSKPFSTREEGSSQIYLPEVNEGPVEPYRDVGTWELHEFRVKVIPRDWGLGTSTVPERWQFVLANKQVLIQARPMGEYHGKFGIFVQTYEQDLYSWVTRGMLETVRPMQDVLDWLINSHIFNIRKVLNDMMVVDPSMVTISDLTDPMPGRLIRLRPRAYGVAGAAAQSIQQLQVQDVTQTHLKDMAGITEMMQRMTGVTDNVMGQVNSGRRTATEIRTTNTLSLTRLKTLAEWLSAQAWAPMSQVMLQNTQQYYDLEREFRIAGSLMNPQYAQTRMRITPADIQGFYDFVPVDGTMPVDRYAQANLWGQLMAQIRNFPQIMMSYDMGGIFEFVAQLAGLKNISQFRVQVTPDQMLQAQLQAGNVVPMGGPRSGKQQQGGTPRSPERTIEPGQIPGMGQTS